jgi:uncharacterized protein (DUF2147 family)
MEVALMKRNFIYLSLAVLGLFLSANLFAEDFSSVTGKWKTKDDETGEIKSIVELYVSGDGTLQGKIVKLLKKDNDKCDKCPGDSQYPLNTPIEGMIFVWDVKKLNEKSGKIFDPAKAKMYSVQFWKEGNNLKVRGYIAFFYRTQTWYPAD